MGDMFVLAAVVILAAQAATEESFWGFVPGAIALGLLFTEVV